MKIPKYVQELMSRSKYDYRHTENPNYAAGYTIRIHKSTEYAYVRTLRQEAERIVAWANRVGGEGTAHVLYVPEKTHYYKQAAVVTIFDPVMEQIECFMPYERS